MTVQAYIPREDGRERWFEWYHERRAAIDLVKAVWTAFHASTSFYAVVANVAEPPADALIITHSGLGVLEFKHYGGQIQGRWNSAWYASGESGKIVKIRAGHYRNPYYQVSDYTERLKEQSPGRKSGVFFSAQFRRSADNIDLDLFHHRYS